MHTAWTVINEAAWLNAQIETMPGRSERDRFPPSFLSSLISRGSSTLVILAFYKIRRPGMSTQVPIIILQRGEERT